MSTWISPPSGLGPISRWRSSPATCPRLTDCARPNGLPMISTWLPSRGARDAGRAGRAAPGSIRSRVSPVSASVAIHRAGWRRPEASRATIVASPGGWSIRTESTSPWSLTTTPLAIRRDPDAASATGYSSATADSRTRSIASATRRSIVSSSAASPSAPVSSDAGAFAGELHDGTTASMQLSRAIRSRPAMSAVFVQGRGLDSIGDLTPEPPAGGRLRRGPGPSGACAARPRLGPVTARRTHARRSGDVSRSAASRRAARGASAMP